jgi:hypothetical protein
MSNKKLLVLSLGCLILSACAHMPDDEEKTAFRSLQQEVNAIESKIYGAKGSESGGLSEQLKYCSLQLHDRVNPEEIFSWSEKTERHTDKDYFSDPDAPMKEAEYRLLTEKYKIYRQVALSKKESLEGRLKTCQSDLKSFVRAERLRSEREQVMVEKALSVEKAMQKNEAVVATPLPVPAAPVGSTSSSMVNPSSVEPSALRAPAAAPDSQSQAPELVPSPIEANKDIPDAPADPD